MTIEDRLRTALERADEFQPSPDLWDRVQESIEADAAHRRRIRRIATGAAAAITALAAVAWLAIEHGPRGARVAPAVLEILETVGLGILVSVLGPAIRRFGRTFAGDVFRANPETGRSFLGLLDIAYHLVFAGYVLVTVDTSWGAGTVLGAQLGDVAVRTGGLLVAMGVLHAATVTLLPIIGIVFTSGWRRIERPGRPIPPALLIAAVVGLAVAFAVLGAVIALTGLPG